MTTTCRNGMTFASGTVEQERNGSQWQRHETCGVERYYPPIGPASTMTCTLSKLSCRKCITNDTISVRNVCGETTAVACKLNDITPACLLVG